VRGEGLIGSYGAPFAMREGGGGKNVNTSRSLSYSIYSPSLLYEGKSARVPSTRARSEGNQ